jgi:hypothetical protein
MEVKLALLADYANVTKEGKLNVMGVFSQINAPVLPWVHPQMQLVLQLEAGPAEWGKDKRLEIKLLEQDGRHILSIGADLKVPRGQSGRPVQLQSIMSFVNVPFEAEGDYCFHILLGEDEKKGVPLRVSLTPPQQPTPQV